VNWTSLAGFIVVIAAAILIAVFAFIDRKQPRRNLRPIPAFDRLKRSIGLAVEDGSRVHITLGSASLTTPQNPSALLGMAMLERIAGASSISDRPPAATSGDGGLMVLSQDTLRSAYRSVNALDLYDASRGRMTGATPFSYAAGAMPVFWDENVSTNVLVGNFGIELALMLDAAERENSFTIAASDSLPAQAILYAAAQEPLIGEELFAGGAYLQAGRLHTASLHTQDVLRWGIIAVMVVGSLLKLIGVL
jgi:hypothetical protein